MTPKQTQDDTKMTPKRIQEIELYAWVGEDELGSGEIGLKQGLVPAGCIPLVAIDKEKISRGYIVEQLEAQAKHCGKRIFLCKFICVGVEMETVHGCNP
jgi:hypothetical protein